MFRQTKSGRKYTKEISYTPPKGAIPIPRETKKGRKGDKTEMESNIHLHMHPSHARVIRLSSIKHSSLGNRSPPSRFIPFLPTVNFTPSAPRHSSTRQSPAPRQLAPHHHSADGRMAQLSPSFETGSVPPVEQRSQSLVGRPVRGTLPTDDSPRRPTRVPRPTVASATLVL